MKTAAKRLKGFKCLTCGKRHAFGGYVMAHWDLPLTHTCDGCGAVHEVRAGNVKQVSKGRKRDA